MRFSVIVPVYNAQNSLPRCVASVLSQSISDWELLLVDDGSTDESASLADRYAQTDARIRALHQPNLGQLAARQRGIACAAGDYLLFLDSDDCWTPDCLAVLSREIEECSPDVVLFPGRAVTPDGAEGLILGQYAREKTWVQKTELYRALLSGHDYNAIWLKAFRRSLFENDLEDYSPWRERAMGEDKAQLLFPLTNAQTILFVPQVLYRYTLNPVGVIRSWQLSRVPQAVARPMFALLYRYMKRWGMDVAENRERLAVYYLRNFLSVYYGALRRCRTAAQWKAFVCYPWRQQLDCAALAYRHSPLLTAKEKVKLWVMLRWILRERKAGETG